MIHLEHLGLARTKVKLELADLAELFALLGKLMQLHTDNEKAKSVVTTRALYEQNSGEWIPGLLDISVQPKEVPNQQAR